MRRPALLTALLITACSSPSPSGSQPGEFLSARDHLVHPTDLAVAPATSGGAIRASRYSATGWIGGDVPLLVERGEITARADEHGQLQLSRMRITLAPLPISADVIKTPTQLDHLELDLEEMPTAASTLWSANGDAATAIADLKLQLSWSVTIDGTTTKLGPQHLPAIPAAITVDGIGGTVDATFTLESTGTVWSWAGLIDIRDLRLVLDASSSD